MSWAQWIKRKARELLGRRGEASAGLEDVEVAEPRVAARSPDAAVQRGVTGPAAVVPPVASADAAHVVLEVSDHAAPDLDRPGPDPERSPEAPAPVSSRPVRQQPLLIVVGLDFGTSSTKIVVRRQEAAVGRVVCLEKALDGYPWFAIPSDAFIDENDEVWFGKSAWSMAGGEPLRWLKIDLLQDPEVAPPREPLDAARASLLATAFLSWVLGRLKETRLDPEYGPDGYRVLVQTGVPLARGTRRRRHRERRFLRVLHAAHRSVFEEGAPVLQGTALADLEARFADQLDPQFRLPDRGGLMVGIKPESLAALEAIRDDPRAAHGHHTIVDIGAGTTDTLVVRHFPPDQQPDGRAYQIYEDGTLRCGAADLQSSARTPEELTSALDREVRRNLQRAVNRDGRNTHQRRTWSKMTVITIGGGCREVEFADWLEGRESWKEVLPREGQSIRIVPYHPAGGSLEVFHPLPPGVDPEPSGFFLLAVALGLSKHRRLWGQYFVPEDLEEIDADDEVFRPLVDRMAYE